MELKPQSYEEWKGDEGDSPPTQIVKCGQRREFNEATSLSHRHQRDPTGFCSGVSVADIRQQPCCHQRKKKRTEKVSINGNSGDGEEEEEGAADDDILKYALKYVAPVFIVLLFENPYFQDVINFSLL